MIVRCSRREGAQEEHRRGRAGALIPTPHNGLTKTIAICSTLPYIVLCRYVNNTTLSARVAALNPSWNEAYTDKALDEGFAKAMALTGAAAQTVQPVYVPMDWGRDVGRSFLCLLSEARLRAGAGNWGRV